MEKTIIIESIIGDNGDCEDGEDGEDDGEDNDDGDVSEDGNMVVGTGDNLWYSLSWQSLLSRSGDAHGGECECHKNYKHDFHTPLPKKITEWLFKLFSNKNTVAQKVFFFG